MTTNNLDTSHHHSDFDRKEIALLSIELLARERRESTLSSAEANRASSRRSNRPTSPPPSITAPALSPSALSPLGAPLLFLRARGLRPELLDAPLGVAAVAAHVPLADRAIRTRFRVGAAHDACDQIARAQLAAGWSVLDARAQDTTSEPAEVPPAASQPALRPA